MPSPYLDRLLRAAMRRRDLDTLALRAFMKATHLLGLALAGRLREYRDGRDPALDRFAQIQEQILHASLLREALDVLGSRWDKLPERQRPHYSPQARFRILRRFSPSLATLSQSADPDTRSGRRYPRRVC
jgi:hypothetical protein